MSSGASSSNVNTEGVMLFEQPFARVPFENYRKVFRTTQRQIEKDFSAIQATTSGLVERSKNGGADKEDAIQTIDAMITRVENLKRKLSDLNENVGTPTQAVMKERLEHLSVVEDAESQTTPEYQRWSDTRLDRWLIDWTLRTGRERTAKKLTAEKDIHTLVDVDMFMDIRRIELGLLNRSCTEALAWCNENKAALRKLKSTLEFDLRLQEYIELARLRQKSEAIGYLTKHISWNDAHAQQIKQAATLLAFSPDTNCVPYKRLYDPARWDSLVRAFRLAVYSLNSLPTEPLLNLALYAGLASLKLPSCYDASCKNIDCPVCDADLGVLAQEVPSSHHVISTIVCQISGKIMNENNPPMAFPNGYVYSREALEEMAAQHGGIVTCPRSHKSCTLQELRKVFVS
ncbi:CTLH/CRA C-terminal to lish motif domain-containing protein [Thelephora terrestris]|uniref:CTLH/CRA C-terminal to lish motif domain-containing protein n=1 Tax=Thelephora terrestris TaxID=56493 RepID=A0A9P6L8Z4_9AGAM|nr:CTLH/CRA C-terminal to lish motif domain-containing protein [Thelephora terrestris]